MPIALDEAKPVSVYDSHESPDRHELTQHKLCQLAEADNQHERDGLCDEIVLLNMPVALAIARRYRRRGAEFDDLVQVAQLGLVEAVGRYDPDRGSPFLAFAVPTIAGEVKRYFRDCCWAIRPARRVQEIQRALSSCEPRLTQVLERSPTPRELADELDVDKDQVVEALATDGHFELASLDTPANRGSSAHLVADDIGEEDWQLRCVEDREFLAPALEQLSEREQRLLWLRFVKGWKQKEIARDLGISQMHVSRLLSALMQRLRGELSQGHHEYQRRHEQTHRPA